MNSIILYAWIADYYSSSTHYGYAVQLERKDACIIIVYDIYWAGYL